MWGRKRWVLVLVAGVAAGRAVAVEPKALSPREGRFVSAAFAPDDRTLATLDGGGTVRLWDVASGEGRKAAGLALAKGEAPKRVGYTRGGDLTVLVYRYEGFAFDEAREVATQGTIAAALWNLASGKRSPFIPIGYGGAAVCPEGRLLAYADGLWELATGRKVREFVLPAGLVYDITFSPDGKTLAYRVCEGLAQDMGLLVFVDVASGRKRLQVGEFGANGLGRFLTAAVFAPDGKTVAFAEPDRPALHLWDVSAGREVRQTPLAKSERAVGFTPDGGTLVSWCPETGTARLWEKATGKERHAVEVGGGLASVVLSPDGRTVALVKGDAAKFRRLWD